ncbi:MAG: hydrogenase nickel incorporation protein HypB [Phycisphaerae bacterium]|jgi:hydrogenase nickel incorporation protein HypB|nr:hydrogenase nickel incorporation protein HypB [Phycisphaerae bacterium]HQL54365.1 hydrogenase nickel incorporation protein HypB [Phycisphaerae bacterium]
MKINVVESVLKANDAVAQANRQRLDAAGILAINLMSAPGSGKTTLLEKTIAALGRPGCCAVIVGDLQTTRDAERLGALTAQVTQINTGTGCHLTATQVAAGLDSLDLKEIEYLFIENVGNMVCPAGFDLGEHRRAVLLSVPEGDDKVAKYPTLFQPADVILLTKVDLLGILDYQSRKVYEDLSRINTRAPVVELSSKTGQGITVWLDWVQQQRCGAIDAERSSNQRRPGS